MKKKTYREERSFVLRFTITAEFEDDYGGEDDGYEWAREWAERVKPAVVRAAIQELRRHPRFRARVASRGADPDREVEIAVEFAGAEEE